MKNAVVSNNLEIAKLNAIDLVNLAQELDKKSLEYRDTLNLGHNVRFGIELEYEGVDKSLIEGYIKKQGINWKSTDDETLSSGGEVVSPKLVDERKTWENLKSLCEYLKAKNADTSHNAGLHVHVGAHILGENIDAWRKFAKLYTIYERVLIRFGYGDKINARSTLFSYAKPVGLELLEDIHILDENKSLSSIKEFYRQIYDIKRNAINLRSLEFLRAIVSMNTLEFRNFNSTTDKTVIQNDINASCHMLMAAASKDLDEDYLNYRLIKLKLLGNLGEKEYFLECSQILLREAAELVDLIFDNTLDKMYFIKQYIKSFESCTSEELNNSSRYLKR